MVITGRLSTEPVGFVWVTSTPPAKAVWVADRDTLFQYLEQLNDKFSTGFIWRWSGNDKVPNVEVYEPELGLHVEAPMGYIQESIERMLPIWGLE